MEDSRDEKIQNFINYRNETKIAFLAAKLVPNKNTNDNSK